jgi:RimJ/RimL family protein N-acetyltransferase
MPVLVGRELMVRRLRDEDRPLLEAMYDTIAPLGEALGLPPRDLALRHEWLAGMRPAINLVGFVDGKLAGHLALFPDDDDAAELMCFVHQDFRRLGLATALSRAAVEEAHAAGYRRIAVFIDSHNKGARQGLLKFGFRPVWEDIEEAEYSLTL